MRRLCFGLWKEVEGIDMQFFRPGQTETQVESSFQLASTCVPIWPGIACTCVDKFAMTCVLFGPDPICMQVNASFSPFGHPTQINAGFAVYYKYLISACTVALKWLF